MPTEGAFVPVQAATVDGWVQLWCPNPIRLSARELAGALTGPAAIALVALAAEALRPLHDQGDHHGSLSPDGVGFDADGVLRIRPALHRPALQEPGGGAAGRATDCLALGRLLRGLLGGSFEDDEAPAPALAGLSSRRAPLLLAGLTRARPRLRIQPAAGVVQASAALLHAESADGEEALRALLRAQGLGDALRPAKRPVWLKLPEPAPDVTPAPAAPAAAAEPIPAPELDEDAEDAGQQLRVAVMRVSRAGRPEPSGFALDVIPPAPELDDEDIDDPPTEPGDVMGLLVEDAAPIDSSALEAPEAAPSIFDDPDELPPEGVLLFEEDAGEAPEEDVITASEELASEEDVDAPSEEALAADAAEEDASPARAEAAPAVGAPPETAIEEEAAAAPALGELAEATPALEGGLTLEAAAAPEDAAPESAELISPEPALAPATPEVEAEAAAEPEVASTGADEEGAPPDLMPRAAEPEAVAPDVAAPEAAPEAVAAPEAAAPEVRDALEPADVAQPEAPEVEPAEGQGVAAPEAAPLEVTPPERDAPAAAAPLSDEVDAPLELAEAAEASPEPAAPSPEPPEAEGLASAFDSDRALDAELEPGEALSEVFAAEADIGAEFEPQSAEPVPDEPQVVDASETVERPFTRDVRDRAWATEEIPADLAGEPSAPPVEAEGALAALEAEEAPGEVASVAPQPAEAPVVASPPAAAPTPALPEPEPAPSQPSEAHVVTARRAASPPAAPPPRVAPPPPREPVEESVNILERQAARSLDDLFSSGQIGVRADPSREQELGLGKWGEEGRSLEEIARDMPDTPVREMDLGDEEEGRLSALLAALGLK